MLVLLLHDETETRRRLASFFAERGLQVETAMTGVQTVNKAILIAPDAIVIDMDAPDGSDAARQLKSRIVTRRIPIVALRSVGEPPPTAPLACDVSLPRACAPDELLSALRQLRPARRAD